MKEFLLAVIFPIGAIFACGFLRMVASGGRPRLHRYCLGIELTLAGLAAVIGYYTELGKRVQAGVINVLEHASGTDAVVIFGIAGVLVAVFLVVVHQQCDQRLHKDGHTIDENEFWWIANYPLFWLFVVGNIAGGIYCFSFFQLVRTLP